jgi:hypothetical protein
MKLLDKMNSWSESTVLGKQMMIKCIMAVRREALTAYNIKAEWRASGLWSLNMLMSRLLLENPTQGLGIDGQLHPPQTTQHLGQLPR